MLTKLRQRASERGASAVEYGLLVAAIAALIAVIVFALGGAVRDTLFNHTCEEMKSGMQDTTTSCSG